MAKTIILVSLLVVWLSPWSVLQADGITVSGHARVSVAPDMATFNFSVLERGTGLSALKKTVDERSASVIKLARRLGVADSDITSAELRIRPRYSHPDARLLGYDVSRDIRVVLNRLDDYSALVNGAIEAGVSSLGHIQLDVRQRESLEITSLAAAMDVARRKALVIADEAGVKLGRVTRVTESATQRGMPLYQARAESMAMESGAAFEPGEIVVSSELSVTFAIDNGSPD